MYVMALDQLLTGLRDAILPARSDAEWLSPGKYKTKAITFAIYISLSKGDVHKSFTLHVMFFGNTSVFYTVTPRTKCPDWTSAINATNHDSCWRSMEFLSPHFFNIAHNDFPDVVPNDIHQFISFRSPAIQVGDVVWSKDPTDYNNYLRKVVSFNLNSLSLHELVLRGED